MPKGITVFVMDYMSSVFFSGITYLFADQTLVPNGSDVVCHTKPNTPLLSRRGTQECLFELSGLCLGLLHLQTKQRQSN